MDLISTLSPITLKEMPNEPLPHRLAILRSKILSIKNEFSNIILINSLIIDSISYLFYSEFKDTNWPSIPIDERNEHEESFEQSLSWSSIYP